jgi:hypothetical protein
MKKYCLNKTQFREIYSIVNLIASFMFSPKLKAIKIQEVFACKVNLD